MIIFRKYLVVPVFLFVLAFIPPTNVFSAGEDFDRADEREALSAYIAQYMADNYGHEREDLWASLADTIYAESERYAIDYRMVMAIIKVESNFHFKAASHDGARGIMQLKPPLAKDMARRRGESYHGITDLLNPLKNIRWGISHLAILARDFSSAEAILFAYNVGHMKAKRTVARDGKPKTSFVQRVMREYEHYLSVLPEAPPREEPAEFTI
ncbi:MAG: transglycosylase SLT domain-containing protein [Smithellaceae bacterium]|nr:transglycosylase SLT domain-containing protein [Smithellaceae bacterium]